MAAPKNIFGDLFSAVGSPSADDAFRNALAALQQPASQKAQAFNMPLNMPPNIPSNMSPNTSSNMSSGIAAQAAAQVSAEQLERYKLILEEMRSRLDAPPKMNMPTLGTDIGRRSMLAMRLHVPDHTKLPFHYLSTALTDDKVFVFIIIDGQAVTLSDERAIFPSDALVTQVRLLMP
jgi:hypothetical protein